jgi:hypothetical protein
MHDESARRDEPASDVVVGAAPVAERVLDILFVPRAGLRRKPQIGVPRRATWRQLAERLSHPAIGDSKEAAGAWSPAVYRENVRRKQCLLSIGALVVDVDGGADVARAAAAVGRYRAIIHETFSSTAAEPRCRIVIDLGQPVDVATYERTHAVVRAHLRAADFEVDERAKDASRLSFMPVRPSGAPYAFVASDGVPLSVTRVLGAQPPQPSRRKAAPPVHADAYVRAALRRATQAVASAPEGTRNSTLNRETFCVARFDVIDDATIEAAMIDAALAAGLTEPEARRTIVGAVRARRGVR